MMIVLQIHIKLASIKLCIRSNNAEKLTVLRCYDHNLNTDRKRRVWIWSGLFAVPFYENADLHIWYTSALLYRTLLYSTLQTASLQQHPYFNRSKKLVINTTRADIGSKTNFKHLYISYPICCEHFENSHYVDPAHTSIVPQTIPTIFSSGIPNPPQMIAELRPRRCRAKLRE